MTVSDYEVNLEKLPYNNIIDPPTTYHYYNPNNISGYWDIQTACFSAGKIWVVQPFYDSEGNYIADQYDSGTFQITLEDANLQITSESGTKLDKVEDNTNQAVQTDDRATQASYLSKSGTIGMGIRYISYTEQGDDGALSLTEGCADNGKDWILRGDFLGLYGNLYPYDAEGQARIIAADYLLKFDDAFFEPERVIIYRSETTVLYGAKPEGTGWDHKNLQPNEAGYDAEMMQAIADDLIFFSSLEELKQTGYTCVAVLLESRRLFREGNDSDGLRILGKSKDDSTLDGNSKTATGLPAGIWYTAAEFVTAVLRRDGIPYDTVRLSSQNGWAHVWYGLEESHVWTVEEMEVPEGFSAAVYQQGTRFTIVNSDMPEGEAEIQEEEPNFAQMEEVSENREIHTSNVPKTGDRSGVMLWAALLAISGAGFAGVWILDRRRRKKEKHRE